jgi:hypothetical protein
VGPSRDLAQFVLNLSLDCASVAYSGPHLPTASGQK